MRHHLHALFICTIFVGGSAQMDEMNNRANLRTHVFLIDIVLHGKS